MESFKQYDATGGNSETFSIPSFTKAEIKVYVDGVLQTESTHYTIPDYTTNGGTVTWVQSPTDYRPTGKVRIVRDTKILNNAGSDVEGKATYAAGSSVKAGDLNDNQKQTLRALQEQDDQLIQRYDLEPDVINGSYIADDSINSEHYVADSIDTEHYAPLSVDTAALANDAVTGAKIADNTFLTANIGDDQVTYPKIQNVSATDRVLGRDSSGAGVIEEIAPAALRTMINVEDGATADQTNAEIRTAVEAASDSNVFTDADHSKLNAIEAQADVTDATNVNAAGAVMNSDTTTADMQFVVDEDDFSSDLATKVPTQQSTKAYIAATSQPLDSDLTTLAGMQSATASILASSTALTSTTAELNLLDGKSIVTTISGSSTDAQLPTAQAVDERIVSLVTDVGGFVPIANETSFPATNPDPADNAGTIVSVKALASNLTSNGSGVATIANGAGSGNTVTINGMANSDTIEAGKGILVETTSTLHTYTFHRETLAPADVTAAQTLVTDFNQRYQVASSEPSNQPDGTALADGDLWFDTSANTMKVYDLGNTQYNVVTSVGDFKILTILDTDGSAFDGTNQSFNLKDGSNAATVTSAGQLIVSVNGVIQKPNTGTGAPAEGFALVDSDTIIFGAAPGAGASVFVTLIGAATSVNVPATNSIVEAAIQTNVVSEEKLKVSNSPTNGQFLSAQNGASGGLTWATVSTDLVSDTSPQLGGDLDVNGNEIISSATDGDIELNPNGTGDINLKTAVGGTTNLTSGGDVVFSSGVTNALCQWDYSQYQLEFWDGVKASFGSSEDLEIWHDATDNQIKGNNGKIVISTTAGNSDIEITPNGTGDVVIDGLKYPQADGTASQALTTNGSGQLSWSTVESTKAGGAIYENSQTISETHTLTANTNGMSAGPVTVNSGITLTIPSGATYTIV